MKLDKSSRFRNETLLPRNKWSYIIATVRTRHQKRFLALACYGQCLGLTGSYFFLRRLIKFSIEKVIKIILKNITMMMMMIINISMMKQEKFSVD